MITLKKAKRMTAALGLLACFGTAANAVDIKASIMFRGDIFRAEKNIENKNGEYVDATGKHTNSFNAFNNATNLATTGGDVEYFWLSNFQKKQIDNPADGLLFTVDGGNYGAQLALWYQTAKEDGGENQWTAYFRRTYGWFKPVDALTLRFGYVGCDNFFKEKIDEWKVGSPFAIMERDWGKHPLYVNCNDVEGWGFGVEYRPIDALVFNAGITPGKKGSVTSTGDDRDYAGASSIYNKVVRETGTVNGETKVIHEEEKTYIAPWGAGVKYYWKDFEFQASYRDGGMDTDYNWSWSVLRFGAGVKNQHTYSFIQPIFGFDYYKPQNKKTWDATQNKYIDEKGVYGDQLMTDGYWRMNGMCLDLYSEVYFGAWTVMAHAPVTFRWSGAEKDNNYMELNVKAKYNTGSHGNLDDVAPYVQFGSNQEDAKWGSPYTWVWMLNENFANSFNMSYKLGVEFKVGAAEVDVGAKFDQFSKYHKEEYGKDWSISVPFVVKFKKI